MLRLKMPLLTGTSGWQYRHWRETVYPRGVAQDKWLADEVRIPL